MRFLSKELIAKLSEVAGWVVLLNLFAVVIVLPVAGHAWIEKWKALLWLPLLFSAAHLVWYRRFEPRTYLASGFLIAALVLGALLRGERNPLELNLVIALVLLHASYLGRRVEFPRWFLQTLGWAGLVSSLVQLFMYRYESRPVLSVGDPNYSGLILLLYFIFVARIRFWPGILFSVVSAFVLLSRNYLLALAVFGVIEAMRVWFARGLAPLLKLRAPGLFALAVAASLSVSALFVGRAGVGDSAFIRSPEDVTRLYSLHDDSNKFRFEANLQFVERCRAEPLKALNGWGRAYFDQFIQGSRVLLHNSFLELIARSGLVFAIVLMLFLAVALRDLWTVRNLAAWSALFCFACFLHSVFEAKYFVLFLAILSVNGPGTRRKVA